jgi:predicted PurR-regulated permease PerM
VDKQWLFIIRSFILLLVIVGVIWLLHSLTWVVGLILVSILIVYLLYPILQILKEKYRLSHGISTILTFVLFILLCAAAISLFIPVIINEVAELADNFPHYLARFQTYISWVSQQTIKLEIEDDVRNYLMGMSENLHQAIEYLAEASFLVIGRTVDIFLVLFLVFYFLHDFQAIREGIIAIFPVSARKRAENILLIIDTNIGSFIRGSLIRCLIVGVVTGLILLIVGMPYALLLGFIAGVFNFILYIGPYIAAIPALLLSLSPLTPSPLIVVIIYVIIQVFDGIFLAPLLLGRILKLKPITIILAILAGGSLAGILGMVLAVPFAGIIKGILDVIKSGPAYHEKHEEVES